MTKPTSFADAPPVSESMTGTITYVIQVYLSDDWRDAFRPPG
jgi:hypothetical protein